jgi:hypothetical protein
MASVGTSSPKKLSGDSVFEIVEKEVVYWLLSMGSQKHQRETIGEIEAHILSLARNSGVQRQRLGRVKESELP